MAKIKIGKKPLNKIDKENLNSGGPTKDDLIKQVKGLKNSQGKMIKILDIKTRDPFKSLFPINPDTRKAIADSIKKNGYDNNQPVIIWLEKDILIDGNTRRVSSQDAGLKEIPVIYMSFKTQKEALDYAYNLQLHRRNLTDSDRLTFVTQYLVNHQTEYGKGDKRKIVSGLCGISVTKAQRLLTVINKATQEQKEDITNNIATINKVYNEIQNSSSELILKKEQVPEKEPSPLLDIIKKQYSKEISRPFTQIFKAVEKTEDKKKLIKELYEFVTFLEDIEGKGD